MRPQVGLSEQECRAEQGRGHLRQGQFHGRTVTVVSFSTDEQYREGFGPFTPGFSLVDFGDAEALEKAINKNTVAFLVEPIQAESGILVPPDGYLRRVREICDKHNILFIADEIQTGLCRTGDRFAWQFEGEAARPDMMCLGKALGGGVVPISAIVTSREIIDVFKPGDHGSTFGGNPLACAVARVAMDMIVSEGLDARADSLRAAGFCRSRGEGRKCVGRPR